MNEEKSENNEEKKPKKKPNEFLPDPPVFPFENKRSNDLPWEMFLGKQTFSQGVLLFSYYFKRLGMPQVLTNGDWYFVNAGTDEQPNYMVNLYLKDTSKEDLTFSDYNFLSSGKYIRIPSIKESFAIIMLSSYTFSFEGGFLVDPQSNEVSIKLESEPFNNQIVIVGHDVHDALIKSAYHCYLVGRNLNGFSQSALAKCLVPSINEGEDSSDA